MVVPAYKKRLLALYGMALAGAFIVHTLFNYYNPFLFESHVKVMPEMLTIQLGDDAKSIAQTLQDNHIIPSQFWFLNYIILNGWDKQLKYGKYQFLPGDTPVDVAKKIHLGEIVEHRFTIIAGWKFSDLRTKIKALKGIQHTIAKQTNETIAQYLQIDKAFLDGAFFPETYYYTDGEKDIDILKRAHDTMELVFQRELENYQQKILDYSAFTTWTGTLHDKYKVLSLAAIIEKETFVDDEYPIIASVFHNRLLREMRLQADPTVIYAIGDQYKGRIRTKHLRFKSPYNTYTTKGLPPFPIAYASEKAIQAALNPANSNYLYFVAKGDGRAHIFNSSLQEHSKAVDRYWKIIEKRKRRRKN